LGISVAVTFTAWKMWELQTENNLKRRSSQALMTGSAESGRETRWVAEIRLHFLHAISIANQDPIQLAAKLDIHISDVVDSIQDIA
jgi:hypothetical protein